MKVIIDRFEGEYAVVEIEEGKFFTMAKELVDGAKEGDIIDISICHEETKAKKEKVQTLLDELFE